VPEAETDQPTPVLKFGLWIVAIGVGLIVWSGAIVVIHLFWWLRFGNWPHYPTIALIFDCGGRYPTVKWLGVQKIINFVMLAPASAFLLFSGLAVCWSGGLVSEEQAREDAENLKRYRDRKAALERLARGREASEREKL
jgi:hypothetical protein